MAKPLSDEQLDFFRLSGFLHIPGLIPADELAAVQRDMKDMIDRGLDGPIEDASYCYGPDATDSNRQCLFRINGLIREHHLESVQMLLAYPPLLEAISQAVGGEPFVSQVHSCVFKIPQRGYPVPWHQDPVPVYRFPVFNVDVYLDQANADNACLHVIPGSHLAGYHGSPQFVRSWTHGKEEDAPGAIPVHTQPGDVLFHATSVLHGSFWNRSDSLRRTVYFHINHYPDVMLRPEDDGHRGEYMQSQQIMEDAIALRKQHKPDETPFDFKTVSDVHEPAEEATA